MAESQKIQDNPTTVDGVRAIEIRYRAIMDTSTKNTAFYQSSIRLNAPNMGVLLPERYMPVLESDDRCVRIFLLALLQTLKAAEKFTERELDFDWISIVMPLRILHKKDCVNIMTEFTKKVNASPDKICFEIPPLVVDEYDGGCRETMQTLREAGYHTMIAGMGGDSFPLLKLAEFEPEYVMMNEGITQMLGKSDRSDTCVQSVISFINSLDAEPIATGVYSSAIADKLYELECSFYTADEHSGDRSGNFMPERFIRKRNQN